MKRILSYSYLSLLIPLFTLLLCSHVFGQDWSGSYTGVVQIDAAYPFWAGVYQGIVTVVDARTGETFDNLRGELVLGHVMRNKKVRSDIVAFTTDSAIRRLANHYGISAGVFHPLTEAASLSDSRLAVNYESGNIKVETICENRTQDISCTASLYKWSTSSASFEKISDWSIVTESPRRTRIGENIRLGMDVNHRPSTGIVKIHMSANSRDEYVRSMGYAYGSTVEAGIPEWSDAAVSSSILSSVYTSSSNTLRSTIDLTLVSGKISGEWSLWFFLDGEWNHISKWSFEIDGQYDFGIGTDTEEVEIPDQGSVQVFPTPSADRITIQFYSRNIRGLDWVLYDITGAEVRRFRQSYLSLGINNVTYDVSSVSPGLYFIGNKKYGYFPVIKAL